MTQSTKGTLGTPLTYVSATALVNYVYNNGDTILFVKNGSASPITVTIDSRELCNQGIDHDIVVTVANATEKAIGMFNKNRFNDGTSSIKFTLSSFTTISYASVEVLT